MYIDVVCDVHIRMSQQSGENLYVHPFVIAIRRKSVPKDVFALVVNASRPAGALCLVSQCLVGQPVALGICKYPFAPSAL